MADEQAQAVPAPHQRVSMRGRHRVLDRSSGRYAPTGGGADTVIREGRLGKFPRKAANLRSKLGAWHFRWVRLYSGRLEYTAEDHGQPVGDIKGAVAITQDCRVEEAPAGRRGSLTNSLSSQPAQQARFTLVTPDTSVLFFAETAAERADWITAIEAQISAARSSRRQSQLTTVAEDSGDALTSDEHCATLGAAAAAVQFEDDEPGEQPPIRLLSVGTANAGNSTLLTALRAATGAAGDAEMVAAAGDLAQNMTMAMRVVVARAASMLDVAVPAGLRARLAAVPPRAAPGPELWALLADLWADGAVQAAVLSDNVVNHGEADNLRVWFDEYLPALAVDQLVPEWAHALHAKRRTHFAEAALSVGGRPVVVCDFPGARAHRRKWTRWLPDLDAVVFAAAASSYNQSLADDPGVNALEDAVAAFGELWRSRFVRGVPVVLLLTKVDVFARKLRHADIRKESSELFMGYEAGTCSCPEAACTCGVLGAAKRFVLSLFVAEARGADGADDKLLVYEFVNAMDMDAVQRAWQRAIRLAVADRCSSSSSS